MLVAVTNYLIIFIQFNSIAPRDGSNRNSASAKEPLMVEPHEFNLESTPDPLKRTLKAGK